MGMFLYLEEKHIDNLKTCDLPDKSHDVYIDYKV